MDNRWKVDAIEELEAVAHEFLSLFPTPTIFAFDGEMGAGKTTFITQLLNGLKIYHLDWYRIEQRNDILNLGLEELLDEKAYFFIEWAEKIDFILPTNVIWVYIRNNEINNSREIAFQP